MMTTEGAATAWWTCESPALPGPVNGVDTCEVADGKIRRLTVQFED